MAWSQLALYNQALRFCGERRLASLAENREPRRLLDDAWDANALRYCLEQGQWTFATRSAAIGADPDVTTSFGYRNAFGKPDDWVRTVGLCSDEYFNAPLTSYSDEGGRWYADIDPLYVRYVSNDAAFGADYAKWPDTFAMWVAAWLAEQIAPKLTGGEAKVALIEKKARGLLVDARSKDAMNQPAAFPPPGGWVQSRQGGRSRLDRGNRGSLLG
jgi:hypothetical protein